jgi:superfamily II DNA or RNA helicase
MDGSTQVDTEQEVAMTPSNVSSMSVAQVVEEQTRRNLEIYRIDPGSIAEHANGERRINQGGYGDRQIYELVQNGADEMRDTRNGEIRVILTKQFLYCANQGEPMTPAGADTILRMSVSRKRGGQIGRFGVGVKSVLTVSNAPQFFSTTGAFGFDREWAEKIIREVVTDAVDVPVLRTARNLDAKQEAAQDPLLAELLTWASTVVRLPLLPEYVSRLSLDLRTFPAEFQLFSPHVAALILEDRTAAQPIRREQYVRADGNRHTLQTISASQAETTTTWRVFRHVHEPSEAALAEAGELHDRPTIDIAWAVPLKGSSERGTFWAYFPTNYQTTLRGLLNAPWKTSEDRQNLFDRNQFNNELIGVAAELVVRSLPELVDPADPGSYQMQLPGRGREAPQWADERLTSAVWTAAAKAPSLPDQEGVLRAPHELRMPPENLPEDLLKLWADHPGRPSDWTHRTIESRERRAKARLVFEHANRSEATAAEWLEALVADRSPEASARAVRILAQLHREKRNLAADASDARILLTESGEMVSPMDTEIFQRAGSGELADDLVYVDPRVTDVIGVRSALAELGVHEATAIGRLTAVLDKGFAGFQAKEWGEFWKLCRQVTVRDAVARIAESVPNWRTDLRLHTMDGDLRRPADCLLPGRVVPTDGSRDRAIAVDLRVHGVERQVLVDLGMSDVPAAGHDPRRESWFEGYREAMLKVLSAATPAGQAHPKLYNLTVDGTEPPGPLGLLVHLSDEGRREYLRHLPPDRLVAEWTARAGRQILQVESPLVWMARRYGKVRTGHGIVDLGLAVSPALKEYGAVLPVAQIDRGIADVLKLPSNIDRIPPAVWARLVQTVATSEDDTVPGMAYALVLRSGTEWPGGETRCRVGDRWDTAEDALICVTADRGEYDSLVLENVPALLVPAAADVDAMVERWGMRRYSDTVSTELRKVEDTEPVAVVVEFPHLRQLRGQRADGWNLVQCSDLDEVKRTPNGIRTIPLNVAARDRVVYLRRTTDKRAMLEAISAELGLDLKPHEVERVLTHGEEARKQDILKQVRADSNVGRKMLLLLGAERLRRGLPEGLLAWEEARSGGPVSDERIAELACKAHGDAILRHHRADLAKAHETLGVRFNGDSASMQAVNDLRLPETYAGVREEAPRETELVIGPTPHFPLHDYQEQLAGSMYRLVMQTPPARGMLSLPTGGGKTRIAVEAIIRYLKEQRSRVHGRPILWIAQSEELCEQAVQSWKYVWEKAGVGGARLTISRFWSTRTAHHVRDNVQLVIATDDKLTENLHKPEYEWLHDPAIVVIDEAHASITKSYTAILERLGLTPHRTARPLIGLTATPFRGNNEAETDRLVKRYAGKRLDLDAFENNAYAELQAKRVLAKVDHQLIEGGDFRLTDAEVKQLENVPGGGRLLPKAAEKRLADNHDRTDALIKALLNLDEDWPVLVFATSVDHAHLLAAILNDSGVPAASVDSETPSGRRRRIIEQFGKKRIRVLTNYGVLHQGFDAPATRAVVVARPTYSPNVYQQMIGRGLRGPANGGTERCLILNVRDNIVNYGSQLAFTKFEWMWNGQ